MSEELKLKPCLRCRKDVSVIHAHGCKFIRCDCGIQSSRYGEHIADWRMVADWNFRPVEDSQAVRIAELEKMAEARKLANRLLEQERNELEVEYDRLREALKKIVALSTPDRVCNNCKHCQELGNTDWCGWNHKLLEDASSQECGKFEAAGFIVPETHTIARKVLEGVEE